MQTTIEQAIERITGQQTRVTASGRTDAGAHALGQVIAFTTESALTADVFTRALNAHLPDDIVITAAEEVPTDFHPRYDASSRTYRYLIWNRPEPSPFWKGRAAHVRTPLDATAMSAVAQSLVGEHDFSAFVAVAAPGSRVRTIQRAEVRRDGDMVTVELEGTGFMQQMVRTIVGTLVRVGLGQLDTASFEAILESCDRARAGDTAPACGLYLMHVSYGGAVGVTTDIRGGALTLHEGKERG